MTQVEKKFFRIYVQERISVVVRTLRNSGVNVTYEAGAVTAHIGIEGDKISDCAHWRIMSEVGTSYKIQIPPEAMSCLAILNSKEEFEKICKIAREQLIVLQEGYQ